MEQAFEPTGSLRAELNRVLTHLFGAGNAHIVLYAPEKGAYTASFRHAVQAGSPLSKVATASQSAGPGTASSANRAAQTNFQNSTTNTFRTGEVPQTGVVSAAVWVNSARVPLTPVAMQTTKAFLHNALGIPASSVTVVGISGAPAPLPVTQTSIGTALPLSVAGGLVLLLAAGSLLFAKKRRARGTEPRQTATLPVLEQEAADPKRLAAVIRRALKEEKTR